MRVFVCLLDYMLPLHVQASRLLLHLSYPFPHLVLTLLYSSLHLCLSSAFTLQLPGVFWGVMTACYVVSQLWVIRSNIISKAINERQCLCVFYSLSLFFFSFLPEHINKLTFYPYRLKLNYIQGNVSHGAE